MAKDEFLSKSSDDPALEALEAAVSKLLGVGAVFVKALETKLECKNGHGSTAFHAKSDGTCRKCGGWMLWKSGPGPSDAPARPLHNPDGSEWDGFLAGESEGLVDENGTVWEKEVRREMERLSKKFHGSRAALKRAAVNLVKSRAVGRLDGRRIVDADAEKGPRLDGQVQKPRGKRAPRIL